MRIRHLKPDDYRAMPWKNGGGRTLEIAVGPEGAGFEDFLWRLSIAEVGQSGRFSTFAGVDRTLTVLTGAGIKLDFDEGEDLVIDVPLRPTSFDGARACEGHLIGGPVEDFNVMTRHGLAGHRVRVVRLDDETLVEALENEVSAILVLAGSVSARVGEVRHSLGPREVLLAEHELAERVTWELYGSADTVALLVEIDLSIRA